MEKGQLPPNIRVAVSHLRDIGKYGAHDEEIEVAREDVPLIENLADAVLEFVYRSPAAITALEKSIVDRGGQLSSAVSAAEAIAEGAETVADVDLG